MIPLYRQIMLNCITVLVLSTLNSVHSVGDWLHEKQRCCWEHVALMLFSYAEIKKILIGCEIQQPCFFVCFELHRFFLPKENWMGNIMLSKCCRKKLSLTGKRWRKICSLPHPFLFPLITKLFLFTYWSFTSLQQKHIMAERNVLLKNVKHPFLVGLHYSFQTTEKLYFVLDFINGGEVCGDSAWIWASLFLSPRISTMKWSFTVGCGRYYPKFWTSWFFI